MNTGIIPEINTATVAKNYEAAKYMIKQAFDLLNKANNLLLETFGERSYVNALPNNHMYTEEQILSNMNKHAWAQVLNWINIENIMSAEDIKALRDKVYESDSIYNRHNSKKEKLPEFSYEELQNTIMGAMQNSDEIFRKAVKEVWDLCTPGKLQSGQKLKTNKNNNSYKMGEKVILSRMVEGYYYGRKDLMHSSWKIEHREETTIHQIEKIFKLLDGKKFDPKGETLVAKITTTPTTENEVETEYFKCRLHFNGNLHMVFKRPDIVDKINASVGYSSYLRGNNYVKR